MRARSGEKSRAFPAAGGYAVIMAGGHGTRFWPRSRRRIPKQLLSITGKHTLLQETVRRLLPLFSWRRVLIVTNREHAPEVRRQLPRLPADHVLIEPVGRNTAPCIALAAEWIALRAPEALMVVVPADHMIKDVQRFRRTLTSACRLAAARDCLVTLGIQPTRPETGYGYIELGDAISGDTASATHAASWVRRFHEKPSARVAARYLSSRRYLWNSGMFVWKTNVFQEALKLCLPHMHRALTGVWRSDGAVAGRLRRIYAKLPSTSLDVGVMQPITAMQAPAPRLAVVPAEFDWNDVGSWIALPEICGCDATGNAAIGKLLSIDAHDSIVYAPERLVALVGVGDVIVVDSADALLICARDRAQDVRKVTHALKERGWHRYL
jgi:mannose-1-phosphate guanylyltransferase